MKTLLIVAPLLAGIIILLYTIFANLLRVWMAHRIKMALLDRLQQAPGSLASPDDIQALLDDEGDGPDNRVDYVVVGTVLAAIGLCTALGGYFWGQGSASAGLYFGGVVCVAVGAILVLLGVLVRYLARLPVDRPMN